MVDGWAAFASHPTEDDPLLLLPSPEFDDDDPSSYLLYPPGFGPVADWPLDGRNLPMLAGEAADPHGSAPKEADWLVDGGRKEATVDGPGAGELLGLSEALSGKVSLVGSCGSVSEWKDGAVEYMVIGGLESSGDGDDDVCRGSSASAGREGCGSGVCPVEAGSKEDENGVRKPPLIAKVEMEIDDGEEASRANGGSSESESDGSSSSASSSASSEESGEDGKEDDDECDDEDNRDGIETARTKGVAELEDGEIKDLDAEELAMISDDDEDGGVKGPIRSKNETEVLPPVPSVNVTLEPHHQTLPVGVVSSVLGTKVIVEGLEKHNPLNEGSILWITETRSPLGLVDEIFGPVKNPYYVIRFNSEEEIPSRISEGTTVSFVMEFANHILNEPALYRKGYDASGENDEEVGEEVEFSDDEKEAEYKRSVRQVKRGTDNMKQRDHESVGKKVQFDKRRSQTKASGFGKRKNVQHLASNASSPISQLSNVRSQLQSVVRQPPLAASGLPMISQPPNVPTQIQSKLQQPFNPGQVQPPTWTPRVQGQVRTPAQSPQVPGRVHAPAQPSHVPGQVQAPSLPPCAPGQVQAPTQQHCVPGQLQALQASLQQPCASGQLQGPTTLPYALSSLQTPGLPPSVPGHQAPSLTSNAGCDFTHFVAGQSCFSGPPGVPAVPYGGQLGGPFGFTQQNLLMPQPNSLWAAQQFIANLSSMFQNNGMPCQQQLDHHLFHQNQLFPGFNNGMPFQHQLIPNQGAVPSVTSWQGGVPNPSVGPRPLAPTGQDSLGQAPSGPISTGEQGAFILPNCNQNGGQPETTAAQGDIHASMKFSVGNSSVHGRKSYGRGRRTR